MLALTVTFVPDSPSWAAPESEYRQLGGTNAAAPTDQTTNRSLAEIQDKNRQQNPWVDLKHALEEIIIPEVNVRDTTIADVIDFLQAESQKHVGHKTAINFVWQAPEGAKTAKVTLNLRSVPLTDVLKYVTESAGLRYRIDPHAVVIYKPLPAALKESSPSNAKFP